MNPTLSDNQNTSQEQQKPQDFSTPQVPQLENETPMDITIYPSNENNQNPIEPEKITGDSSTNPSNYLSNNEPVNSIIMDNPQVSVESPISKEPAQILNNSSLAETSSNTDLPPLPSSNKELPSSNTQSESVANPVVTQLEFNPVVSQESRNINPDIQKMAIIGGALIGIILVGILSYRFISVPKTTTETKTETVQKQITTKTTPAITENPTMTLQEYQTKILAIDSKYQSTFNSNPMNLDKATPSIKTIEFVGNEVFAMADEVNQLNVNQNFKINNSKYYVNLMDVVNHLDKILKTLKTNNNVDMRTKSEFITELQRLQILVGNTVLEIKNLK